MIVCLSKFLGAKMKKENKIAGVKFYIQQVGLPNVNDGTMTTQVKSRDEDGKEIYKTVDAIQVVNEAGKQIGYVTNVKNVLMSMGGIEIECNITDQETIEKINKFNHGSIGYSVNGEKK